jgi:CBS domain-containing protein
MEKGKGLNNWIPLITKLVWPFFVVILLLIFNRQVGEVYSIVLSGIKSGRSVEIGGFLKLGEAANQTKIGDLSHNDISIKGIGGQGGVVRKGTGSHLRKLQRELQENPLKTINTLLLPDKITYSVDLLKQYISTLGLRFVVFQRSGKFDGWISSSTFVAQLPEDKDTADYNELRGRIIGVNEQTVRPNDSAKEVLGKMQELHFDSIPVVDSAKRWLFFANRGEILARLMTTIILEKHE